METNTMKLTKYIRVYVKYVDYRDDKCQVSYNLYDQPRDPENDYMGMEYVFVGETRIDFEVPAFNPQDFLVDSLEGRLTDLRADFTRQETQIRGQIEELLSITHQPEEE